MRDYKWVIKGVRCMTIKPLEKGVSGIGIRFVVRLRFRVRVLD